MTNFTSNFGNFTTRSGLYRVWVPLRDDGKSPLISIWIDPTLRAFKSCAEENTPELFVGTSVEPVHDADSATVADSEDKNSIRSCGT